MAKREVHVRNAASLNWLLLQPPPPAPTFGTLAGCPDPQASGNAEPSKVLIVSMKPEAFLVQDTYANQLNGSIKISEAHSRDSAHLVYNWRRGGGSSK